MPRGEGAEFLDRATAYAIGFAEGAVNSPSFGDAHLGPANKRRHVGRIGVPITAETPGQRLLVDSRLKNPESSELVRFCRAGTSGERQMVTDRGVGAMLSSMGFHA